MPAYFRSCGVLLAHANATQPRPGKGGPARYIWLRSCALARLLRMVLPSITARSQPC